MGKAWTERGSMRSGVWYQIPGIAHVSRDRGGAWTWVALGEEGGGASPEECMRAAEAAIRAHARRLLELVGEEP